MANNRPRGAARGTAVPTPVMVAVVLGVSYSGCTSLPPVGGNDGQTMTVPDTVAGFDAATFSRPTLINNPYFPLVPGARRTYRADTDEGTEEIVVEVLDATRPVMGVTCRVVRDRVFMDGVLIEDTHDWSAQDDNGNVWYMGEEVDNYQYDDAGRQVAVTHEGGWEAGKDVAGVGTIARPGYLMKASPMPGDVYHQEYYPGQAEDMGEVLTLDVPVTLADGTTYRCLQTRDFSPLEPGASEHKFYAPGVGVVLEQVVGGDERVELVGME